MNIGIIVYSQTGSTLKACEKIKTMIEISRPYNRH